MKIKLLCLWLFFCLFFSCKDDSKEREVENLRASQKQDSIFKNINAAWKFSKKPFNSDTQSIINNWNEWKSFESELAQKPKSTISAFQQKTKAICAQAIELNKNIPKAFDTPQIKSRIMAVITKIKSLENFIMLDNIPDKKVTVLISDINAEIKALHEQMEITTMRKKSTFEEGEAEMLKSLKTKKIEKHYRNN